MVNVNRPNLIHVGFTKEEKEEITKYSKETNMKITEFIRESIFEKIRKIKNPEFSTTNKTYDSDQVKAMLEMGIENKKDIQKIMKKMDIISEIKRMIELLVAPIKMLPFDNDYKKGQLDMAETIIRLVEVMENKEGSKIAEALDVEV